MQFTTEGKKVMHLWESQAVPVEAWENKICVSSLYMQRPTCLRKHINWYGNLKPVTACNLKLCWYTQVVVRMQGFALCVCFCWTGVGIPHEKRGQLHWHFMSVCSKPASQSYMMKSSHYSAQMTDSGKHSNTPKSASGQSWIWNPPNAMYTGAPTCFWMLYYTVKP